MVLTALWSSAWQHWWWGRTRAPWILHPTTTQEMNFTAQGRISASLTEERGSLGQTRREELSVMCTLDAWDQLFCRGCLLKDRKKNEDILCFK